MMNGFYSHRLSNRLVTYRLICNNNNRKHHYQMIELNQAKISIFYLFSPLSIK